METNPASVLVVDDDDRVLDMAAVLLGSLGYRALTTQSSEAALATIRADPSIELLLTDIVLTGSIEGPDLARLAKAANPNIAIVYSTRYSPMFLLDSEAPGRALLVRKPWDGEQLKATLSNALRTLAPSHERSALAGSIGSAGRPH